MDFSLHFSSEAKYIRLRQFWVVLNFFSLSLHESLVSQGRFQAWCCACVLVKGSSCEGDSARSLSLDEPGVLGWVLTAGSEAGAPWGELFSWLLFPLHSPCPSQPKCFRCSALFYLCCPLENYYSKGFGKVAFPEFPFCSSGWAFCNAPQAIWGKRQP